MTSLDEPAARRDERACVNGGRPSLDKSFSPALQRGFAGHTGAVVEIDAGHGPMLTRPAELADANARAATS
ncbi:hypothetical protein [Pseudonocardia ammonioxydans]|uniref:hypothetical protein n=1 Tax=Pseudonocardia ammonioxydans TaxID=260086 RepID=UPI0015A6599A|nr:hypothetical protein [Pseudonocardia ammonioxydans]